MTSKSALVSFMRTISGRGASRHVRRVAAGFRAGAESLEVRQLLVPPIVLNSRPGAPVTVVLDFDGHSEDDADWVGFRDDGGTGNIITPPFDLDGDTTTFSATEIQWVEEIWYRVAEDYAPFNVNVTTVEPASVNDFEAVLVSIGGDGAWSPPAGGWGIVDGFSTGGSNTSYAFSSLFASPHQIASLASHESGHTFGLRHHSTWNADGTKNQEYDPGDANRAPIMGVGYYTIRDVWDNGPSTVSATTLQDDLAALTKPANRTLRFRADDYGDTIAAAFPLNVTSPSVTVSGVIGQNNDVDMFQFETDAGPISFTVEGLNLRKIYNNQNLTPGTNLDLVLSLYDSNGVLVVQDNPGNSLSAAVSATVAQGTYFLAVSGTGEYGALGQYTVDGTVIPLPAVPTMISPSGLLTSPVPTFQWTVAANAASYELQVDDLTAGRNGFYTKTVTTTTHVPPNQFPQGDFQARVRTIGNNGTNSAWSNYIQFTIDVPTPPAPVITSPKGNIANSFPAFTWDPSPGAATYTLWVNNLDTNQRVIFRTAYNGTSYTHFDPLRDGNYRAWVRAFNAVGEFSAWSSSVDFSIDSPVPAAPTLTAPAAVTTNTNPRFIWTPVDGVARYEIWANNLSTGQSPYFQKADISRTATFFDPPFFEQGNYIAWIRAINGNDEIGPWSAPRNFSVDILPPDVNKLTGPVGAGGSKTVTTVNPTFTWTAAARAERYELWANNITTGQAQIRRSDIKTTSFTSIANLPQGEYRAWVRGINSAGEVAEWSPTFVFTIDEPTPLVPKIVGPVANPAGTIETATPKFEWVSDANAPFYELQIDNVSLNKTNVISVRGISQQNYTIPYAQRLAEYTYVARVRAYNTSGDVSNWSQPFRFRIDIPDPTTPIIIGPGDTSRDRTPQFSWVHTSTSVQYEILVRDLVRNETIVLKVTSFQVNAQGNEAYYVVPDSMAFRPSTYRFWIRSFNSLGQASNWSNSKTFVISAQLDPAPPKSGDGAGQILLTSLLLPVVGDAEPRDSVVTSSAQPTNRPETPGEHDSSSIQDLSAPTTAESESVSAVESSEDTDLIDIAMGMMADPASHMARVDSTSARNQI